MVPIFAPLFLVNGLSYFQFGLRTVCPFRKCAQKGDRTGGLRPTKFQTWSKDTIFRNFKKPSTGSGNKWEVSDVGDRYTSLSPSPVGGRGPVHHPPSIFGKFPNMVLGGKNSRLTVDQIWRPIARVRGWFGVQSIISVGTKRRIVAKFQTDRL